MTKRIARSLFVLPALACAAVLWAGDDKAGHHKDDGKHAGLEMFKQLAGEWVGKETAGETPGQPVAVTYRVTSAGSAVVETLLPGTDHKMVTVIHRDGADLALTHYCAIGNQPQMRGTVSSDGKTVAFKFVRATNMKSDKDMHMHDVTYTFVDKDNLKSEWFNYNDGKAAGKVEFNFKRKK